MSASANDGFTSMDMASSRGAGVVVGSSQGLFTDAGKVSDWRRRRSVACTSTLAQGLALGEQEREEQALGLGSSRSQTADDSLPDHSPKSLTRNRLLPRSLPHCSILSAVPVLLLRACMWQCCAAVLLAAPPSARYPPNQHHSNCPHTTNTNPSKHGTPQTHNTLSA